ncbi:hypothetical protein [Nocardioides conyzicola]|uniref:hypothetical protein n=1 Tax=Nocardioides conyzicola TaxID=1651781 RepID=UPI0031E5F55F
MIVFSGLRYAAPVLLLLLAGCSAGDGSNEAKPSAAPSPSATKNPLIGGPAPSAALEPLPSDVRIGLDARELLRPGVEHDRLATTVQSDLEALTSVHLETTVTKDRVTISNDVHDSGRCSGEMVDHGHHLRFVTTKDARLLITTGDGTVGAQLNGRWVETPHPLADACVGGVVAVVLSSTGIGNWWGPYDMSRQGVEHVDGRSAVHFRKVGSGWKIDTWIAADGEVTRLVKMIARDPNGTVTTSHFTEYDEADALLPVPSPDQIFEPGTSTT